MTAATLEILGFGFSFCSLPAVFTWHQLRQWVVAARCSGVKWQTSKTAGTQALYIFGQVLEAYAGKSWWEQWKRGRRVGVLRFENVCRERKSRPTVIAAGKKKYILKPEVLWKLYRTLYTLLLLVSRWRCRACKQPQQKEFWRPPCSGSTSYLHPYCWSGVLTWSCTLAWE